MKLRKPAPTAPRVKISPQTRQAINPPARDARGQFLSRGRGRKRRILDETEAIELRVIG